MPAPVPAPPLAPVRQQALTALFPVVDGHTEALAQALRASAVAVCARLALASTLHFARFVPLPAADDAQGHGRASLLFATTFDGELDAHLAELWDVAGADLDTFFLHCEGWRSPGSGAQLERFVRRHLRAAAALFSAQNGLTVQDVQAGARLRADVARVLDEHGEKLRALAPLEIVESVRAVLTREVASPGAARLRAGPQATMARERPAETATTGQIVLHQGLALATTWLRSLLLDLSDALRALWHAAPKGGAKREPGQAVPPGAERCFSHVAQLKPGKSRRAALRLALRVLDELTALATARGTLAGAQSIHGARWVLLEDGRLVLLGDFADSPFALLGGLAARAGSALSMLWSHTRRFPLSFGWRFGGARDEARLRRFARDGAVETPLWYSAYPELGGREIRENAEICRLWAGQLDDAGARRLLALIKD